MFKHPMKACILVSCIALGLDGASAEEQAHGQRNPKGAPELAQYDFLIGDWDTVVTIKRKGSEDFVYEAKWDNRWIADGYTVMQQWHGPYSAGIELRVYDKKSGTWLGQNSYQPQPGGWYENVGQFIDGEMHVTTTRERPDGVTEITKEIYHDISENSFTIRSETSVDGGKTWEIGELTVVATRTKAASAAD